MVCYLRAVMENFESGDDMTYDFDIFFEGVIGLEEETLVSTEPKKKKQNRKAPGLSSSNPESSGAPAKETTPPVAQPPPVASTEGPSGIGSPILNLHNILMEEFCNEFSFVDAVYRRAARGKYILASSCYVVNRTRKINYCPTHPQV